MKIKRMVKRLFAVGTGVAMLGATAMGAMAAVDLKDYPNMFVKDGVFDGYFVVGENAASVDNLAMTDIAASMKYLKADDSTVVSVEGDNWKVGTSAKFLEMANSNATASAIGAETFRDITSFIGDDELDALKDGTWSTNEQDYTYQQFLYFDDESDKSVNRIVKYAENDDDVTGDTLFFKSGRPIARYLLEFTSTAQSDVTDSAGTSDVTGLYLDDFENTGITLMGKDYTVVLARRTINPTDGAKLTLMSGSTGDTLLEGESKTYKVKDKEYDVTLSFVDADEAKFTVNGEATNKLKVGETYVLSDKSEIGVSEVLYQDYAGGVHSTTFFVGATKMVLQDDTITDSGYTNNMKVGSEDIDGTRVVISGTNNNVTFSISTIAVNMSSEDDFFVGKGEKLSAVIAAADEEDEVLMNGAFDVEYLGLEDQETKELKLKTSSAKRYLLHLFDGDGNSVDIPVAYAEAASNLSIGEETQGLTAEDNWKQILLNESMTANGAANKTSIDKSDYFIVTGGDSDPDDEGTGKSYLLQYKGADRSGKTSPKISFKNMGSGETLEYSSTTSGSTVVDIATIKLGGSSFAVRNTSSQATDDFTIAVDFDGSGGIATKDAPTDLITFVDYYGSEWIPVDGYTNATYTQPVGATSTLKWQIDTPNANDYDNVAPEDIYITITATSDPEVRAALSNVTLVTPDGETEVSYGYTSMGTFITFNEPASDPDELTLAYPVKQKLPQVYFTSGATSSSTTAGGTLTKVEIVDATKLDSEIADAKAQNLIVVGGPCVNTVAAELLGSPASCTEGFTPGKARVKLFEQANGNVAMLVAGYSGADTRLAGKVLANTNKVAAAGGTEVEIEGTTTADAVVGAPAAVETIEVVATEEVAATTE